MKKLLIFITLALSACSPVAPQSANVNYEDQNGRIILLSMQTFKDSGNKYRDILVFRDSETGKEYIAVIGAGITELETVCQNGKSSTCTEQEK